MSLVRFTRNSINVLSYVYTHPANRQRRGRAVARAIRFQIQGRLGRPATVAQVGNSMLMAAPLHATGASKAVYANPPDWSEMQTWRKLIHPGDIFVDVGSNVGMYSLWAADCKATPIAIEPDPANAERTRENLRRNGVTGEVHQCAAADKPGTMRLTLGRDTVNHLVGEFEDTELQTQEVEVRRLDDIIAGRHVRGIKIDVEGAERLVLEGATQTLKNRLVDVLQIEWNGLSRELLGETRAPVAELLSRYGYVLCQPDQDFHLRRIESVPDFSDSDLFAVSPTKRSHG